jgi:subtilase family serine protease
MRSSLLPRHLLGTVVSLLAFTFAPIAFAAAVQDRITQPIADEQTVALTGTVPVRAKAATDLGSVAMNKPLTGMTIRFSMTAAQETALDQLLAAQLNPASPLYHQWLTPEQFAAQFGVSAGDLAKVSAWLTSKGFVVTGVARGGTFISFNGTAAQVQQAFGTTLHNVSLEGEQHFAPLTEPTVPAAFSGIVSQITGLSDFHPKARARSHIVPDPTASVAGVKPEFTSSISGNHYIAPGDFYTIYDTTPLLNSGYNGTGITIAVMGQTDIYTSDVSSFRSASGLSTTNLPTVKLVPTSSDPGVSTNDLGEASLDVEWSGAVAPNATILYVNSTDVVDLSLTYAIDYDVAPIITISYGDCEAGWGNSMIAQLQQLFKQANAQGQTVMAAAGDSGATDCEEDYSSSPTVATHGLAVDFPGSSPNVTSLGGSMFNEGTGTYWNTTNNTYSGSAISYIPEQVWNETSSTGELSGGGGGASSYFTKPAWQVGTGVPTDYSRDVPDIVLNAAVVHDGTLYCSAGFCTNGYRNSTSNLDVVGGTSVAAPSFAGVLALIESKISPTKGLGNINPTLYALANNSTYYASAFHDIQTGNNAMPCTLGTTNCTTSNPNYNSSTLELGYNAGVGYDLASGWGSVDASNMATDWPLVTPIGITGVGTNTSTTSLSTSASTVASGTAVTLTVSVASGSSSVTTTPTGTIEFLVDGTATGSATLSSGSATYSLTTASLAAGLHTITAAYSGDTTYMGSKGTASLDITSTTSSDFTLTASTTSVTVASGATSPGVTFTVAANTQGYVGDIVFSATTANATLAADASVLFSVSQVNLTSGTTSGTTVMTLQAYITNAKSGTGLVRKGGIPFAASSKGPSPAKAGWIAGSGVTLAALLLIAVPRRRRLAGLIQSGVLLAIVSIGMIAASGCSAGEALVNGAPGTTTNTPAGTYTVTVTATGTLASTGATTTHTSTITYTVH